MVSLDHVVGAGEQGRGNVETKLFCSLDIDDQLEFRGSVYRQIAWLVALENPRDVKTVAAIGIFQIVAIAHQAAGGGGFALAINAWNGIPRRKRCEGSWEVARNF